jgi:hypothetical protein
VTLYIPVDQLLMPPNITAGSNMLELASLAYMYRTTLDDAEPIDVAPEGKYYRIVDGKHRFMASVVAGRVDVLCEVLDA